jgi:hypothetical protein
MVKLKVSFISFAYQKATLLRCVSKKGAEEEVVLMVVFATDRIEVSEQFECQLKVKLQRRQAEQTVNDRKFDRKCGSSHFGA